ncbi:F0F1 ATP synthase subunit B [Fodinicurvata sp. EGI_FJ10296]|jgi:F-type H+-transporting ATPase subunit b|uniref:F0F1 ATP synthase subunit B family protein n=1 Tax=Fodinicurvata sp. EGI_FJ10296 TaxID=3231908 RepID=UPI00345401F2
MEITNLWLLIALVIFLVIAWKPAKRAVLQMLDSRSDRIRAELEEAQRLREEAQAELANVQRRHRDSLAEAEDIIAHARVEAERIRERSMADLERAMERRESQAMDRIAQAEAAATSEVRTVAVDTAIAAAEQVLRDGLTDATRQKLIDSAIEDLPNRLN